MEPILREGAHESPMGEEPNIIVDKWGSLLSTTPLHRWGECDDIRNAMPKWWHATWQKRKVHHGTNVKRQGQ